MVGLYPDLTKIHKTDKTKERHKEMNNNGKKNGISLNFVNHIPIMKFQIILALHEWQYLHRK